MGNAFAAESAFDALGDPQRRRIIQQLRHGPVPVGELAETLPIGRPAVSKHLRVLQGSGLVSRHAVGTRNLYALAPEALMPLQQWLTAAWSDTLQAFGDHAATSSPLIEAEGSAVVTHGQRAIAEQS